MSPLPGDDDIRQKRVDSDEEFVADTVLWIADNEAAIERLAAETGAPQERTIGIEDANGRVLLRVRLTCEPRQFAKRTIEGEYAEAFKSRE